MKIKSIVYSLEKIWHILVFLLLIGAFIPLWQVESGAGMDAYEGNALIRGLLIVAYGLSLLPLPFMLQKVVKLIFRTPWLWLLILWSFFSFAWSDFPLLTLRRGISLLLATLYAVFLYIRYPFRELMKLVHTSLLVVILGSLGLVLIKPDWAIMQTVHPGAWRGVLTHKNLLGIAGIASLLTFTYFWQTTKGRRRTLSFLMLLLTIFVFIKAESITSFLIILILVIALLIINLAVKLKRQWPIYFIFVFGLLIVFGFILATQYDTILDVIGRDITLTGRIPLWETLIPFIKERPLLGFGYRTFWLGNTGPSGIVWEKIGWNAPHAHNGYIDVWLQLGLIGLILTMIFFIDALLKSIIVLWAEKDSAQWINHYLIFLYLFFMALYNLSETIILQSGANFAFYWVLLVCFYLNVKINKKKVETYETTSQASYPGVSK